MEVMVRVVENEPDEPAEWMCCPTCDCAGFTLPERGSHNMTKRTRCGGWGIVPISEEKK